jgi:hypothetical protein
MYHTREGISHGRQPERQVEGEQVEGKQRRESRVHGERTSSTLLDKNMIIMGRAGETP